MHCVRGISNHETDINMRELCVKSLRLYLLKKGQIADAFSGTILLVSDSNKKQLLIILRTRMIDKMSKRIRQSERSIIHRSFYD